VQTVVLGDNKSTKKGRKELMTFMNSKYIDNPLARKSIRKKVKKVLENG
jgi:hypothetical protein